MADSRTTSLLLIGAVGLLALACMILLRERAAVHDALTEIRNLPEREPRGES